MAVKHNEAIVMLESAARSRGRDIHRAFQHIERGRVGSGHLGIQYACQSCARDQRRSWPRKTNNWRAIARRHAGYP